MKANEITDTEKEFVISCIRGNITRVNYLYEKSDIDFNKIYKPNEIICKRLIDYVLKYTSKNGYLEVILWLYENCKKDISNGAINEGMEQSLLSGEIDTFLWLYHHTKVMVDIRELFKKLCIKGDLNAVKTIFFYFKHKFSNSIICKGIILSKHYETRAFLIDMFNTFY
jgi:hypothetical protein